MAKVSPLMVAPPVIFVGLALMFYFGLQRDNPEALPSQIQGQPAPAVAVAALGERALLPGRASHAVAIGRRWDPDLRGKLQR